MMLSQQNKAAAVTGDLVAFSICVATAGGGSTATGPILQPRKETSVHLGRIAPLERSVLWQPRMKKEEEVHKKAEKGLSPEFDCLGPYL
jgi:hypothetical protein